MGFRVDLDWVHTYFRLGSRLDSRLGLYLIQMVLTWPRFDSNVVQTGFKLKSDWVQYWSRFSPDWVLKWFGLVQVLLGTTDLAVH